MDELSIRGHISDLRRAIIPSVVMASLLTLIASFYITDLLFNWAESFQLHTNSELAVYSPYDWYVLRWSASILTGVILAFPLLSYGLYKFIQPGLLEHEQILIRNIMSTTSLIIISSIALIVYYTPEITAKIVTLDGVEGVRVAINPISIASIGVTISWLLTMFIILTSALCSARALTQDHDILDGVRLRIHIIFAGMTWVLLSEDFEGIKVTLILLNALLAESLSRALLKLTINNSHGITLPLDTK
ncbi:MAG: hypothetical protein CMB42_00420 [Euryarchaeota archaeon]|nr:hypothetical protein [Euryarchaeota archaeon]|tara:strand:+ start:1228 stop:1968 length:741 start_codon:yes stop_codon:yes gene_type:complete